MFGSQCRGNNKGYELCIDPKFREVLGRNWGEVWREFSLMGHIRGGRNWDSLWGVWVTADMSISQREGAGVENCTSRGFLVIVIYIELNPRA